MFVNPCNYTLEFDEYVTPSKTGGHERSAFDDPDIIEEEGLMGGSSKGDKAAMYDQLSAGTLALDEAHIKAELILAFKDKKQLKKEAKEKQAGGGQRKSLYNRLFKRNSNAATRVDPSISSSDSSSDEERRSP